MFGNSDEFYDEARVGVSVKKLHYVRGFLEELGGNLRKNTALNLLRIKNMGAKVRSKIFHRWAGKSFSFV